MTGDEMALFDAGPASPSLTEGLSAGQRLTLRNQEALGRGVHPATGRTLRPEGGTCGGCAHHHAYLYHSRTWHKCDRHRLGESHSAASDVRVGWPACALFEAVASGVPAEGPET